MKKLLLLSTILLVSASGYATDVKPYVEGKLSENFLKIKVGNGVSSFKDSLFAGGSFEVGTKIDQFRVGLEGFINEKAEDTFKGYDVKLGVRSKGVFLNAYYDIPLGEQLKKIKPYVGAGVGHAWYKEIISVSGIKTGSVKGSHNAWNVGTGVAYGLDENVDITLGYRFEKLDSDSQNHKVSLGLRYTF